MPYAVLPIVAEKDENMSEMEAFMYSHEFCSLECVSSFVKSLEMYILNELGLFFHLKLLFCVGVLH
jgi:hypothetical protein